MGEKVQMRLDRSRRNLPLLVPVAVDRNDPSDLRLGIVIADHHMPTDDEIDIVANSAGRAQTRRSSVMSMKSTVMS